MNPLSASPSFRDLESCFAPETHSLLTRWAQTPETFHSTERALLEFGRLAGLSGLPIREQLRNNPDQSRKVLATEEWRRDGITLALAIQHFKAPMASRIAAALLCRRFEALNTGASPSLEIHLDRLLKSGYLELSEDLRIQLNPCSESSLLTMMEATIRQSVTLTRHQNRRGTESIRQDPPGHLQESSDLARNLVRLLRERLTKIPGCLRTLEPGPFVWT